MAKETKIGLALCVLLIGAFAFVVYSKMQNKSRFDDDVVVHTDAAEDAAADAAPPPFDDADPHPDFGGEPKQHDHHGHEHDKTFGKTGRSTADNFDIPQRKRQTQQTQQKHDDFADFADRRQEQKQQQQQQGADPWPERRSNTFDDHGQKEPGQQQADPFAQDSHQHAHHDDTHRQVSHQDDGFGFDDEKPAPQPKAGQDKKTWNLADFLGGKKQEEPKQPQTQQAAVDDGSPFGLDEGAKTKPKAAIPARSQDAGFNPFAEEEGVTAQQTGRQTIQQSAGRTFVDDRHNHDRGDGFNDEPGWNDWDGAADHSHGGAGHNHQSAATGAGSTTQVQVGDEGGFFDDPAPAPGKTAAKRDGFGGNSTATSAKQPRGHDPFGQHGQFQQEPPLDNHDHTGFAEPVDTGHDHPFADHDHGPGDAPFPHSEQSPTHIGADRPGIYVVERGDNFWDISKKQYGAGRYYKALASYNQQRIPDPARMQIGMKVLVPRKEVLESQFPSLCPWGASKPVGGEPATHTRGGFFTGTDGAPLYRVGSQDTLSDIAFNHLGRASRWVQVYAMNRDRIADPAKLKIGTILRLPADASQVQLVRRSHVHR